MSRNSILSVLVIISLYLCWNAFSAYTSIIWIYVMSLGALAVIKTIEHMDNDSGDYDIMKDRYIIPQACVMVLVVSLSILLLGHTMTP